jgi:uncharacterized membrane protein
VKEGKAMATPTTEQIRSALQHEEIARLVAKLFGEDPDTQVREDLRHFKEIMEAS